MVLTRSQMRQPMLLQKQPTIQCTTKQTKTMEEWILHSIVKKTSNKYVSGYYKYQKYDNIWLGNTHPHYAK